MTLTMSLQQFFEYQSNPRNFANGEKDTYIPEDLHQLCTDAIAVFSAEPPLVKMNPPCVFIGNLYGQFIDLLLLASPHSRDGMPWFVTQRFVFLGNYVDYGNRSLDILTLLLFLKINYSNFYQLLRGSHECIDINRACGFFDELVDRFGADEGEKLFNHFNEVFSWMPIAGVIGEQIFCVHGGLSPHLRSLEDIEKIPRPLPDPMSYPLAANLLWSEPDERATGFRIHPKRDFAVLFGADNVAKFLEDTGLLMVIRAGDKVPPEGYHSFAGNKMWTIFSAPRFENHNNKAASMVLDQRGRFGIRRLRFPEQDE